MHKARSHQFWCNLVENVNLKARLFKDSLYVFPQNDNMQPSSEFCFTAKSSEFPIFNLYQNDSSGSCLVTKVHEPPMWNVS